MSGRIICGDAREAIPDEPVDLIVTSPPYNVGKAYDLHDDEMTEVAWYAMVQEVLRESWERLNEGGRMAVNIVEAAGRNPAIPVGHFVQEMLFRLPESQYRGAIVWDKGAAAGASTAWGTYQSPRNPVLRGTYEMIYVMSKGEMALENRTGREPDITKGEFQAATIDVWRDTGTVSQQVSEHPAAFPTALARRLIQLYSWPGDTVLDPFFGSGTTGIAADALGRHWIGVEISPKYCEIAARRCALIEGDEVPVEFV